MHTVNHHRFLNYSFYLTVLSTVALTQCTVYAPDDPLICDELNRFACGSPPPSSRQQLSDLRHADRSLRPQRSFPGQLLPVDLRNLVITAIDKFQETPSASTGAMWVQQRVTPEQVAAFRFDGCAPDPDVPNGRVCGIQIFNPTLIPVGTHLLEGDLVNVSGGDYQEFDCTPCGDGTQLFPDGRTLPELASVAVERVGSGASPRPVPVTLSDLLSPTTSDRYVGLLVTITDTLTVRGFDPQYAEYQTNEGINIAGSLGSVLNPSTNSEYPNRTQFRNVTGIATYFYGMKIAPRSPADFRPL